MRKMKLAAALLFAATAAGAIAQDTDSYSWLEDVEGTRSLAEVRTWNAAAEKALTAVPGYEQHRTRALALLNDPGQIARPDLVMGNRVANHWVDAANPRGLWRVSPLDSYVAGKPQWRTLIDVDALGKAEGKSWVWHGANCLAPDYTRCLVSLSPGGGDADVIREFDLGTGKFVDGGFTVPLGKNNAEWADRDTLLVAAVDGGTTRSGYPRTVKMWRRGTPWTDAATIAQSTASDIRVIPFAMMDGSTRRLFVNREIGFFDSRITVRAPDGRWNALPKADSAELETVLRGQAIVRLIDAQRGFSAGSLVSYDLDALLAGKATAPRLVMAPTASQSIEQVTATDHRLWVKALDDVSGKLFELTRSGDGRWTRKVAALPANSSIHLENTADDSDTAFVTVEGMLRPTTLMAVSSAGEVRQMQALPAQFDPSSFAVSQHFARSKDATRVPYFLVRRKDATAPANVLIHGYGGFDAAQTPTYLTSQPYRSGPLGLFMVEQGDAFVLANLRGGGEYGPRWHKAALREKRQNSFDDLAAVARDLIATGVARAKGVAISGRSNGGVLVGAAMTQHPELYSAVIAGSPLFDMKRYSHLSAGASWIDEYGDPDKPADWAFMKRYSPYQNVRAGVRYPPLFVYLSTKDDRVHPGHARKMAARLTALGNRVFFHEYLEGGHSVGADRVEDARRAALEWAFLTTEIGR